MFQRFLAIALLCLIAFFLLPIDHWAAFADGLPAVPESVLLQPPPTLATPLVEPAAGGGVHDWTNIASTLLNAAALGLVAWVVKLVGPAVLHAGAWVGQRAAAEDLLRDDKMMAISKRLGALGLDLALGRLGYTREDLKDLRIRNAAFDFVATFVHEQWPEVWLWVDKNKNGQIDWFESSQSAEIPPVDHSITARAPAQAVPAAA